MDCSTSGFPVLHSLLEFAQTHVHGANDASQPSHPLSQPPLSYRQSFPASGSFPMSWLFISCDQRSGASASVLLMNIQPWFLSGLTGLISFLPKGLSRVFSNSTVWKHQFFGPVFFMVQLSHPYITTGKTIALTRWSFVGKVISAFQYTERLVINFLLRNKIPRGNAANPPPWITIGILLFKQEV